MLVWHLHDFWPRFSRGKSCHFWDTNWEVTALLTTSSRIVHEEFKTSTRIRANQCPHWHELVRRIHAQFAHSMRIVYVLPTLARRVCAIRTVPTWARHTKTLPLKPMDQTRIHMIYMYHRRRNEKHILEKCIYRIEYIWIFFHCQMFSVEHHSLYNFLRALPILSRSASN